MSLRWVIRSGALSLHRPIVLGIINVTPDSFSDGGLFLARDTAVEQGVKLVEEGADILDIGGESTRPQGATSVDAAEELRRVLPVVDGLRDRFPSLPISVDTVKSDVARSTLDHGVDIINDVSALRLDPAMGAVCAAAGAGVILMHSRGDVSEMGTYRFATYGADVMGDVMSELVLAAKGAESDGIGREKIVLDPGVGFAKRTEHSVAVIGGVDRLAALGYPVAIGVSRKRVIGELSGVAAPAERVDGTIAANVMALALGARIFRVHDVRAARRALDVAWNILQSRDTA
ncbi:MAG TPA: dihydropteroate synthase [Gemmatimonadaceae bacterium]|nr:dihydropteroate synthase [Gemmatimonadaceae bacterium]